MRGGSGRTRLTGGQLPGEGELQVDAAVASAAARAAIAAAAAGAVARAARAR